MLTSAVTLLSIGVKFEVKMFLWLIKFVVNLHTKQTIMKYIIDFVHIRNVNLLCQ